MNKNGRGRRIDPSRIFKFKIKNGLSHKLNVFLSTLLFVAIDKNLSLLLTNRSFLVNRTASNRLNGLVYNLIGFYTFVNILKKKNGKISSYSI